MSFNNETSFSIANIINPETKQPFGDKYGGVFSLRRPTLLDKINIATKKAASLSTYGVVSPGMISNHVQMLAHIFAFVATVSLEAPPTWFNMSTMHDDDEDAIIAVWEEVGKFLGTFRPENGSAAGVTGS